MKQTIYDPDLPPYNYAPLTENKGLYCEAPVHNMTRVRATWVEHFNIVDEPDLCMDVLACDRCHENDLSTYMQEMMPSLTDEEIDSLPIEDKERLLAGEWDISDDEPLTTEQRQWIRDRIDSDV